MEPSDRYWLWFWFFTFTFIATVWFGVMNYFERKAEARNRFITESVKQGIAPDLAACMFESSDCVRVSVVSKLPTQQ